VQRIEYDEDPEVREAQEEVDQLLRDLATEKPALLELYVERGYSRDQAEQKIQERMAKAVTKYQNLAAKKARASIAPGSSVIIQGTSNPQLNRRIGTVQAFNKPRDRYEINLIMDDDKIQKVMVRPENVFERGSWTKRN